MKIRRFLISLLVVAGLTPAGAALAEGMPFKINGFADGQFHWDSSGGTNNNGFSLHDGAIYLSAEVSGAKLMVDLPFNSNSDTSNFMHTMFAKAQAYVGYKYDFGFWWQLGQWDTIYGFEANDTKDITFSRHGSIYNEVTPATHTGLLIGYNFTDTVGFKALIANGSSTAVAALEYDGESSTGLSGGRNFQYGGQLFFNGDMLHAAVGYLYEKKSNDTNGLLDVTLGADLGDIDVDGEFVYKQIPNVSDSGIGFGLEGVYHTMDDDLGLGLRFDWLSKFTNDSEIEITAGPQYKLTKNLTGKFDYTFGSVKAVSGGTSETTHAINVSALYAF